MALRYFCESNFSETSLRLVCLLKFCNFVFKRCVLADHINLKYVQHVRLILFNVCVYWGCECNTLWSFWTYSRLSLSEVGLSYTHLFILNVLQLSYGIHTLWNAHVAHSNMLNYSLFFRLFSKVTSVFICYVLTVPVQQFSPWRTHCRVGKHRLSLLLWFSFSGVCMLLLSFDREMSRVTPCCWSHLQALCTYVLVVGDFLHYPYSLFISSAICPCELSSNWVVCILSFRTRLRLKAPFRFSSNYFHSLVGGFIYSPDISNLT